jgi:hypothetical protein
MQAKHHVVALVFFALYVLCWIKLAGFSMPANQRIQADSCARGMVMLPLLCGLAGSFVYCFTVLLFAVFNEVHAKFFWLLLIFAVAMPVLVFKVI